MNTEEQIRRYWAFISYSHADKKWADWLHRSLENYPIPRDLIGKPTPADTPVPKRFVPVFRDREELPTSSDLGFVIHKALKAARFLVVICSPRSAKSQWVEQEIVDFKRLHGEDRVLALIVDGEPWAGESEEPGIAATECFPRALRYRLGEDGGISENRAEPIAADAREGKDGRENAVIKLMAGLLGVGFDDLRRREQEYQRRRVRRLQLVCAGFAVLFIAAVSAAIYAVQQKQALQRTLSVADYQLGLQRRDTEGDYAGVAHFARALRLDPHNRAASDVVWSMLAHENQHAPTGPLLKHSDAVTGAFLPDKERIVTAAGGSFYVWSRKDHRLLETHPFLDKPWMELAPRPDGGLVVVASQGETLHYFETKGFTETREPLRFAGGFVKQAAWSPAADLIAVAVGNRTDNDAGGFIAILDTDGRELQRVALTGLSPKLLAWSPDGKHVAAAGMSPSIAVVTRGDEEVRYFKGKLSISAIRFIDDDTLQALDVFLGQLKRWSLSKNEPIGSPYSINPVPVVTAWSPDHKLLLGMRRAPVAYLYDSTNAEVHSAGIAPGFTVADGIWLDGETIMVSDGTGLAQVRHVGPDIPPMPLGFFDPGIVDLHDLSPDGRTLVLGTALEEKTIQFFDPDTLVESSKRVSFPSYLLEMAFSPDGSQVLALCWDGILYQIDWRKGTRAKALTQPLIPPLTSSYTKRDYIFFSPDGKLLVIPDAKKLRLIDTSSGEERTGVAFSEKVVAACWSQDSAHLAVALADQTVHFCNIDGSKWEMRPTIRCVAPIICMALSSDSERIAIVSTSDQVSIHQTRSGALSGTPFYAGRLCSVAGWMTGNEYLFLGCDVDRSRLVDPRSGLTRAWLPVINGTTSKSFVFPDGGSVLLTASGLFGRVFPPPIEAPPGWFPRFLEAFKASRLSDSPDARPIDPDAWLLPENQPPSGSGRWEDLARWLMDERAERPVAPGAIRSVKEMASMATAFSKESRVVSERGRPLKAMWESGDTEGALKGLNDLLRDFPDNLTLLGGKRQLAIGMMDIELFTQWLEQAERSKSVTSMAILDAKVEMASALMTGEPPNHHAATRLVDAVLAADPDHPMALELKGKLSK